MVFARRDFASACHVQDVDSDGFDVEQLQPLVSKQWDRGMETVRF